MIIKVDASLVLTAVLFPPAVAAFIKGYGRDLTTNVILTLLGYIPGIVHSMWLVYGVNKSDPLGTPTKYHVGIWDFFALESQTGVRKIRRKARKVFGIRNS